MGTTATITPETLIVQPGGQVECELKVKNTGSIVDQFSFEALGSAAPWTVFEPPVVSLFPDAEGTTRLIFRPPRGSTVPAGPCPVGVRIRSKQDPSRAIVEEIGLEIGKLCDTFAEVIPRTSHGRWQATHNLAVDNRGNAPLDATFEATDPDDRLRFDFEPPALRVEPGAAGFAKVIVRPLDRFLRGPDVTHPFQIRVKSEGEPPLAVEASMLQQAIIPRWAPRALLALIAGLVAAAVLWATVLKKGVETAARNAAEEAVLAPLQMASAQIADLAAKVGAPAPAPLTSGGGGNGNGTTTTTGPPVVAQPALGTPSDGRLQTSPRTQRTSFTVPEGQVFSLTDILLQNPEGDSGRLMVQRDDSTLLLVRLENFRDLDYHFVAPVVFTAGQSLTLAVDCENPPPAQPDSCTPAAYYSGFIRPAAPSA